ncbi:MAG: FAD synthase [Patescibacteria group bacterium]
MQKKIKVLTAGSFEILHPGHIEFFKFAKTFGDELFVIISCDKNFRKFKKREPVVPENQRKFVVENIKFVDNAILGDKKDFLKSIEKVLPDVIVLGYDQNSIDEKILEKELKEKKISVKIIRAPSFKNFPICKTSEIIEKIKNS